MYMVSKEKEKTLKHITLRLPPKLHREAKLLLLEKHTTFQGYLTRKLEELLTLHQLGVNNTVGEDIG